MKIAPNFHSPPACVVYYGAAQGLQTRVRRNVNEEPVKGIVIVRGRHQDLPEAELRAAHDRLFDHLPEPGRAPSRKRSEYLPHEVLHG